jgi:hypothetical protein
MCKHERKHHMMQVQRKPQEKKKKNANSRKVHEERAYFEL